MVEISRDGRRVYLTNGLYSTWDDQLYPDLLEGWKVLISADPKGGIELDPNFFLHTVEMALGSEQHYLLFQPPPTELDVRLSPHLSSPVDLIHFRAVVSSRMDTMVTGLADHDCFSFLAEHERRPGRRLFPSIFLANIFEFADVMHFDRFRCTT